MGFADVKPFPIPFLVRCKLIDSSTVAVYRPGMPLSPAPNCSYPSASLPEGEKKGEIEQGLYDTILPNWIYTLDLELLLRTWILPDISTFHTSSNNYPKFLYQRRLINFYFMQNIGSWFELQMWSR